MILIELKHDVLSAYAGYAPAMRERAIIVVTVSHVRVRTAINN